MYGCAFPALVRPDDSIEILNVGGRSPKEVSRKILSEIIEARAKEMFEILNNEIEMSGYQ